MAVLKKVDVVVEKVLCAICLICFVGLFVILIANVFFRWVPILSMFPSFSMGWFDEIVQMLFAWMVMTAATVLCRNKEHFRVDIIQMNLEGKRLLPVLEFVINLATLVFYGALAYYGWSLMINAVQTTPVLRMQMKWLYLSVPVNAFLMSVYTVRDAVDNLMKALKGNDK